MVSGYCRNRRYDGVLRNVWANYRDESFISQFLSPRLMRHFRMFHLRDDPEGTRRIRVDAIHDDRGYRRIRANWPDSTMLASSMPTSRWSMSILPATAA